MLKKWPKCDLTLQPISTNESLNKLKAKIKLKTIKMYQEDKER